MRQDQSPSLGEKGNHAPCKPKAKKQNRLPDSRNPYNEKKSRTLKLKPHDQKETTYLAAKSHN